MRLLRIPSDSNAPTPPRDSQVALVRLDMPDSLELWSELPAAMLLAVQIYDRVVRSSVSVPPGIAPCIIPSNMHYTTHNAATTASFDRRSWGLRRPVLHPLPHSRFMWHSASACVLSALQRLNGYVCESSAEEFTIAFACARDALRFALLLQMDLLDLAWPSGTTHR